LTLERCEPYRLPPVDTAEGPIAVFDPGWPIGFRVAGDA
jgi:hypothetical protein